MRNLYHLHKTYWLNKDYLLTLWLSWLFLFVSFFANLKAGIYATASISNSVTDIILDNIRVYDVDAIFIYGPIFLWIFVATLVIRRPEKIPFLVKSIALFILIRSVFISLTHIAPSTGEIAINYTSDVIKQFTFGGDLFFSAHTGLPFLMALVFGADKKLLYLFTAVSIFFGTIVLMGHVHYSIDVFAAFFITYTIFNIAKYLFPKDWKWFNDGLPLW